MGRDQFYKGGNYGNLINLQVLVLFFQGIKDWERRWDFLSAVFFFGEKTCSESKIFPLKLAKQHVYELYTGIPLALYTFMELFTFH